MASVQKKGGTMSAVQGKNSDIKIIIIFEFKTLRKHNLNKKIQMKNVIKIFELLKL